MGDRLRDYGFMNPFRSNHQGSNYNASLAYLSGSGIDQWLVDTATYNKIIKDYGLTSKIEYKQKDGSWSTVAPPKPAEKLEIIKTGSYEAGTRYVIDSGRRKPGYSPTPQTIETMPEYRWVISGDVAGANNALREAGLQGSYTGPRGDKFITGAYIPTEIKGATVTAFSPTQGGGMAQTGGQSVGLRYIDSGDPLGAGINGSNSAFERTYNGQSAPKYYTAIQGGSASGDYIKNIGTGNASHIGASLNTDMQRVANEVFSNPNLGNLIYNPDSLKTALAATPAIRDTIGTYINDTAAYYRSRDDGGGALGVIAAGLGGVAQFAAMASGLNALVTGLGSLASGLGLKGAFNAALDVAGAMPDIGSVVGGAAGSSTIGNLANIGVGGITGAESGGLPGAALGAGGALIGAGIDQAGGFTDFLQDPLGNILGAVGLGGAGGLTGSQLAAMDAASQVGMGSTAQYTPPSSIGQNVLSTDYIGGIPNEVVEVLASAGDAAQMGGGLGSSAGGALGSAAGSFFNNTGGAAAGNLNVGGLLDTGSMITVPTPGGATGSLQTTATGSMPTAGSGTGQIGLTGAPGGVGADGLPIGTPGPYSDAYSQTGATYGIPYGDVSGVTGGIAGGTPGGYAGGTSGGAGDYSSYGVGTTNYGDIYGTGGTGTYGTAGLLGTGAGTGGDGLGGDGLGGDGLGSGLGMAGGYPYGGLLASGGQPGSIGDIAAFIEAQALGKKKKGGQSFYGKLPQPKRRKGIRLRRA